MRLNKDDKVVSVAKIIEDENGEDENCEVDKA
jgi:hypothetical protein